MDALAAWDALDMGWKAAFQQAWKSFGKGSFPVGSSLFAPNGMLIAVGRNRIFETGGDPLAGSLLAHAEVGALSRLSTDERHDDVTLFTTLEPCVFCMGAIVLCRVGTVRYAGSDSYGGAAKLPLDINAQTARYEPAIDGPLDGPFGRLAAALPLVYLARSDRWTRVLDHVRESDPDLVDLAGDLEALAPFQDPRFFPIAKALEEAWPFISSFE